MTPERALELIPILQAYAEEKEIEHYNKVQRKWFLVDEFYELENHIKDGDELRVKPEPKIVPFDENDDLLELKIKSKETGVKYMITSQDCDGAFIPKFGDTAYRVLLTHYTFLDGSPCGKVVQE